MGIIMYFKVPLQENLFYYLARRHGNAYLLHSIWKSLFRFYKIFYCCCYVRLLEGASNCTGLISWEACHNIMYLSSLFSIRCSCLEPWPGITVRRLHNRTVFMLTLNLSNCTNFKDMIMCEDTVHFQKCLGGEKNHVSSMLIHRKETHKYW